MSESLSDVPRDGHTFVVSTRLGDVSVHMSGRPLGRVPALLLLHANPGDSRDFAAVAPSLGRHFTVAAVDWPGYGHSTVTDPKQVCATGLADVAADVADALAARGADRIAVIGNSVGGYAALSLALRGHEALSALVLVDPAGFTPDNVMTRAFCRRVMGSPAVARHLVAPLARAYLSRLRTASARDTYARARRLRHEPRRLAVHCALWRSFADPSFSLSLDMSAGLAVPALLVWGVRDPVVPAFVDGRRARKALPDARFVSLRTGHEPFSERPDDFLRAVEPFLLAHTDAHTSSP